jgi:hypothetical protein
LLSLQFIEYPTNHILIYVITKTWKRLQKKLKLKKSTSYLDDNINQLALHKLYRWWLITEEHTLSLTVFIFYV